MLQDGRFVHQTLETLKGKNGWAPHKPEGGRIEHRFSPHWFSGARGSFYRLQDKTHRDKVPGHSRTTNFVSLLCQALPVPSVLLRTNPCICLFVFLSLRARNCITPCLLGHCIKKGMYEISWLLSHNSLSPSSSRTLSLIGEQGLWEILCQRHRVQWPSHLKKATEVSTPLPP